jgi:hypothetical protein
MAFMGYEGDDFALKTLNVNDYTITQPDIDALRYYYSDIHWITNEQFILHTHDFDGSTPDCNRQSQLILIDLVDVSTTDLTGTVCGDIHRMEIFQALGIITFDLTLDWDTDQTQTCTAYLDGSGTECVSIN